jgi:hypothetical protein
MEIILCIEYRVVRMGFEKIRSTELQTGKLQFPHRHQNKLHMTSGRKGDNKKIRVRSSSKMPYQKKLLELRIGLTWFPL